MLLTVATNVSYQKLKEPLLLIFSRGALLYCLDRGNFRNVSGRNRPRINEYGWSWLGRIWFIQAAANDCSALPAVSATSAPC